MGEHIKDGHFQSDKYDWCKPDFVPLKVTDKMAQDLLWEYAKRRREVDKEFGIDLQTALLDAGYDPPWMTEQDINRVCVHSRQHVNDRSQFVCDDCGVELGR